MIRDMKQNRNQLYKKLLNNNLAALDIPRNDGRFYLEKLNDKKEVSIRQKRRFSNDISIANRVLLSAPEPQKHSRSRRESLDHLDTLEHKFSEFYEKQSRQTLKTDEKQNSLNIKKIKEQINLPELPDFWFGNAADNKDMIEEAKALGSELNYSMAEVKSTRKIFKIVVTNTLIKAEKTIEKLESQHLNPL